MFNFGFVLIFAILGILISSVQVPQEGQYNGYRKSRYTLGIGFAIMAIYCLYRTFNKQEFHTFIDFWLLITISLLFAWLNYTAFLFLIKSEHKIRQHFLIDGITPLVLMFGLGACGLFIPNAQSWIIYLLGFIFFVKCAWMFYTCEKEWRKVSADLENNYDASPDIRWMRHLLWLTLILSIATLMAWYIPTLQIIYAVIGPVTHTYMVLKMVNYSPRKICEMRNENNPTAESEANSATISKSVAETIEAKIQQWIEEKNYCKANLTIKDVSLEIGTNRSYLSKYINSCLNVSFQVWLNTLRIEESKRLLASEKLSIEEIGIRVGIPQSYNFSRWLKVVTGTIPLRYRKEANQSKTN